MGQPPTVHRTAPTNMNDPAQSISSAEGETPCSRPAVLKLWRASESPEPEVIKTQAALTPRVSDSVGLGWALGI